MFLCDNKNVRDSPHSVQTVMFTNHLFTLSSSISQLLSQFHMDMKHVYFRQCG